jgi:hypothetical protein
MKYWLVNVTKMKKKFLKLLKAGVPYWDAWAWWVLNSGTTVTYKKK